MAETTEDTDPEDTGEDVTDAGEPAAEPPGPWRRYAAAGLVAAVFVGAFAAAGILTWKVLQQRAVAAAGEAARSTAVDYAQVLTSVDSNNLDENFAAVLNGATADFKDMYTKSSVQLRQLLIDNKATAHGVVVDSAIASESKDRVTVLLMIDQTVTNTARPDPRVDRSRMKITMDKVGGRWLASKVELP